MALPFAQGALSGLKVVDLSRVLAGPLCTQMLADHGADVVKVEPPLGDETRHLGPPFDANGALMKNGVPAGAVNTVPQAFAQPHVAHRGMLIEQDGHRAPGIPVRLGDTPGAPGLPPPRLNQHAQEILAELKGVKR
ncbi:hypothetical protein BH10PSE6_BH10PSE6_58540 [soil metagenome]